MDDQALCSAATEEFRAVRCDHGGRRRVCGDFFGLLVVGLRPCKTDITRPLPPTESGGSS